MGRFGLIIMLSAMSVSCASTATLSADGRTIRVMRSPGSKCEFVFENGASAAAGPWEGPGALSVGYSEGAKTKVR